MAVVGEDSVVSLLLERIQQEWKCSSPEFVKEGSSVKFCGFELTKKGDQFVLNQQSYARDLLDRHPGVACRSTPFPGVLDEEPETEVRIPDVRAAQGCWRTSLAVVPNKARLQLWCFMDGEDGDKSSSSSFAVW